MLPGVTPGPLYCLFVVLVALLGDGSRRPSRAIKVNLKVHIHTNISFTDLLFLHLVYTFQHVFGAIHPILCWCTRKPHLKKCTPNRVTPRTPDEPPAIYLNTRASPTDIPALFTVITIAKALGTRTTLSLSEMVKRSVAESISLSSWKLATLLPVLGKGNRRYCQIIGRPNPLLTTRRKVFERPICKNVFISLN